MKAAIALVAAVVLVGAAALLFLRDRTPVLRAEDVEAARARWDENGPRDYNLTLLKEIDARPPERIETEVRSGKTTRLVVNGNNLGPRGSYDVPALLDTAARELEMAGSTSPRPGEPRGAALRASFHAQLGVPLVLKRIAPGKQSYVLRVERIQTPEGGIIWEQK